MQSNYLYEGRVAETRQYMLYIFLTHDFIKREQINKIAKIHTIMITNMICEIATRDQVKGWRLKGNSDLAFITKFVSIRNNNDNMKDIHTLLKIKLISSRNTGSIHS